MGHYPRSIALCLFVFPCAVLCLGADPIKYPQAVLQTGETGIAYAMEFSADSRILAAANDHGVTLWDRERKWLVRELIGHTAAVEAVAFAPTGKLLASAGGNGELAIWNWDTGALVTMRKANDAKLFGVKFTSGGKLLTVGEDLTVRLWDDGDCGRSCILVHIPESPESLAISTDDKWMAVGDTVNTVTVWRVDLSTRSAEFYNKLTLPDPRPDNADFIRGLAFDRLGRLARGNFGGAVVLQDVSSWTTVFLQHTGLRLDGVVVDPNGARLYVAGLESQQTGRALAYNIKDGSRANLAELPQYWTPSKPDPVSVPPRAPR